MTNREDESKMEHAMDNEKLRLWFFRDLTGDQRDKLLALHGMPTHEIHGQHHQMAALNYLLSTPSQGERVAQDTAPQEDVVAAETMKAITLGASILARIEDPTAREVAIRNALTVAASASHHQTEELSELDEMVASAIEAAIETSPEFNHGWRSMSDKDLIPEILDEIPIEYTEKDIAEAIYRYKIRRLTGHPSPQPTSKVSPHIEGENDGGGE